jgi:hypothetical protein
MRRGWGQCTADLQHARAGASTDADPVAHANSFAHANAHADPAVELRHRGVSSFGWPGIS